MLDVYPEVDTPRLAVKWASEGWKEIQVVKMERPSAAKGSCIWPKPDLRIKIKSFDGDLLALKI